MSLRFERASKLVLLLLAMTSFTHCLPDTRKEVPRVQPRPTATPSAISSAQPVVSTTPLQSSNSSALDCPSGSEAALPELRNCCRQRNWGQACDGDCWAAGVGEKLKQMCNASQASASDCAQTPAKSKINEWCAFHYNRRYCGVSDADWVKSCSASANAAPASPAAPARAPAALAPAATVRATATPATPACRITQNRGFPFPRCQDRKSAKICEEGVNGNEQGRYCVWTGN